jgi:hypothetical protein
MKFFYCALIVLFSCNLVAAQSKIKHHQITAGIGLISFKWLVYPWPSQTLEYGSMTTTSLFHLKYAYNFLIGKNCFMSAGLNFATFKYNDFYVPKQFGNINNLSRDTIRASFQSNSYLLRCNIGIISEDNNIIIGCGAGMGQRTQNLTNETLSYTDSASVYRKESQVTKGNEIPLGFEMTGFVSYYLNKNVGLYLEAGLAKSFLQTGVVFRF